MTNQLAAAVVPAAWHMTMVENPRGMERRRPVLPAASGR